MYKFNKGLFLSGKIILLIFALGTFVQAFFNLVTGNGWSMIGWLIVALILSGLLAGVAAAEQGFDEEYGPQ
jgi:hypothetical protein